MHFEGFSFGYDFDSPSGPRTRTRRSHPPAIPPQIWGPPTSSDQSSPATAVPYHGLSPDHFYPKSPSPPPHSPSPRPASASVLPWVPSPPRAFSPPTPFATERTLGTLLQRPALTLRSPSTHSRPPQSVRFDKAQIAMAASESTNMPRPVSRARSQSSGGQVTPGLDDSPFIQYALDALTREDGMPLSESLPSTGSSNNGRVGVVPRTAPSQPPSQHQPTPAMPYDPLELAVSKTGTPSSSSDEDDYIPVPTAQPDVSSPTKRVAVPYEEVERSQSTRPGREYGALDYKPTALRPTSFMLLTTLCILMVGALIVSAVYSKQHTGLLLYPGTINSGHYFLFRILPPILGAIIFLYAQAMILTTYRILPFERMSNEDPNERYGAIFLDLYPRSFLWPRLAGPAPVKIYAFAAWLMNFSLPLLSALFGMVYVEGDWMWATVQGVAWTLVALYLVYLVGLGILGWFWFRRETGMLWDIRSIADMVPMLHHSNARSSYKGTEVMATRRELEEKLQNHMFDRLGYWRFEGISAAPAGTHVGAYWWGIGTPGEEADQDRAVPRGTEREPYWAASDLEKDVRYRYLPWALRTPQMLAFVGAGVAVLVALLVVSFIPATRLSRGFTPEVPVRPNRDAFSPANFLYSFVPSLLGQILFLLFQSLEMSYKQLKPWGELSRPEGEIARRSILLDYAACQPFQVIYRAMKRRHYRLAAISTLATVFVFLPVLGGALFTALTISGTRTVRMFPSMPVYGVVLALLGLYVAGLGVMLPDRGRYRLPHSVRCLAEIFSFVANDDIAGSDPAFRFPRDKTDMMGRLGAGRNDESRWWFGVAAGRDEVLGVRRMRRYTEKRGV
ncbi:hypothetical protein VUR80DRAFT_6403 [Thermomyces stellatus]